MGNDMFNDEQLAHLKDRADEIERLRLALAEATKPLDPAVVDAAKALAKNAHGHPDSCCYRCNETMTRLERERDEARALAVSWEREFNVANHERLRLWDEAESFCEKLDQFEAAGFPNVASVMDRIAADLREMRIGDEKRLNAIIAKVTLQRDEERARSERVACRTKNGSPIDYAAWGSLLEQLGELHLRALTAERERDAALSRLGEGAK